MKRIAFVDGEADPIEEYKSAGTSAAELANGAGEAHVYRVHFDAGGEIGLHPAGFGQLFLVTAGAGWVADGDGNRLEVAAGEGAFIAKGEVHAKGSDTGMTALMIQVEDMAILEARRP